MEDAQNRNFEWFLQHYMEIYLLHGNCYVVIYEQRIVYVTKSFSNAVKYANEHYEPGTFNVQHCNGDESGYTVTVF